MGSGLVDLHFKDTLPSLLFKNWLVVGRAVPPGLKRQGYYV